MSNQTKPKHAGGRPSKYTPDLARKICELVATHPFGLPKICKMFPELPTAETIRVWRWEKPEFSAKYTESKQFQAEIMAESIEDVIDETMDAIYYDHGVPRIDSGIIMQARLRVDSRKWTASKLAPKIYGERRQVDEQAPESTLSKIRGLVDELNRNNISEL